MSARDSSAVNTACDYYNSPDADRFYSTIWDGEDIHIGLYESADEPIFKASRRTVEKMAASFEGLGPDSRVLDMGSGYGGSARYLANAHGCRVVALNLSEVENERARELNREAGLDELIEVVDGSFEAVPFGDDHFDVAWSQDAILHSGERETVLGEVARVLKPGGRFTFTDPMQSDDCPDEVLQSILDRIHLDSLGSPGFYRRAAGEAGLRDAGVEDHSEHLPTHYARVLEETEKREDELLQHVDGGYIRRMKKGLQHWVDGGHSGYLAWGIFRSDAP